MFQGFSFSLSEWNNEAQRLTYYWQPFCNQGEKEKEGGQRPLGDGVRGKEGEEGGGKEAGGGKGKKRRKERREVEREGGKKGGKEGRKNLTDQKDRNHSDSSLYH